jgi:hypothetical protein
VDRAPEDSPSEEADQDDHEDWPSSAPIDRSNRAIPDGIEYDPKEEDDPKEEFHGHDIFLS